MAPGWGANKAKITVNVWDFGPLGTSITPLQRGGFPQRKCILKDICNEIVFMKYKKEIQVITVKEEIRAIGQTRLRRVLCYDYLFISRTQLEYYVMFSRTFYDKIRTG